MTDNRSGRRKATVGGEHCPSPGPDWMWRHAVRSRVAWLALGLGSLLGACSSREAALPAPVAMAEQQLTEPVSYNWDIAPILSENCFRCHGNDAGTRKAGLRLDMAEDAYARVPANKQHRAIVPGSPGDSELMRRILSTDPDKRMPPLESHKTLSPRQIALLDKWIKQGARYEQHWAYISPAASKPPASKHSPRALGAIDQFVYARLEKAELLPSPEADRATLINRVTLDLTGLPPTLAEVDAFLADAAPGAYEKVVDRLLASSRYGERMAAEWMDVARYSETDGYLDDRHNRFFAPWRDWVIAAFNRDLPYDTFVTWQLAGDLIPNASPEQILATAFARLGKRSTENGIIDEEYRVEYRNERTELIGKAFLGLTVGGAKCHDHKYDAISQKDYYALSGFFDSIDERGLYPAGYTGRTQGPTLPWPTAEEQRQLKAGNEAILRQEAVLESVRKQVLQDTAPRVRSLVGDVAARDAFVRSAVQAATVAHYPLDSAHGGSVERFKRLAKAPAPDVATPEAVPEGANLPATPAVGSVPVPALPNGIVEGDVLLSDSATPGVEPAGLERPVFVPGVKGQAFLVKSNRGFLAPQLGYYDRTQAFSFDLWLKPREGKPYEDATVVNHQDHTVSTGDAGYTLHLENNHLRLDVAHLTPFNMLSVATVDAIPAGRWTHVTVTYGGSSRAADTKIYVNGQLARTVVRKDHLTRSILPTGIRGLLGGDFYGFSFGTRFRDEEFTDGALDEIRLFSRDLTSIEVQSLHSAKPSTLGGEAARAAFAVLAVETDPRVLAARQALSSAREAANQVQSHVKEIMVLRDAPQIRATYVLDHGLYDQKREPVRPAGLSQVSRWDPREYGENRLGLAKWLFDAENPLTARVYVNRLWASHFGIGIVETVEDFGTQGAHPTNPELLDWLAVAFRKSGWDIKHMQKLIVMSATYRQSSNLTPELTKRDPRNQLLARGPRFRLPAEVIRDSALLASGLLVEKLGGGSVYPYQPPGVWDDTASPYKYPVADAIASDQHHRRSLYTYVKRGAQVPAMATFDFADRNVCTVSRRSSNTPLQALILMNDPQFMETYRVMAERVLRQGGDVSQQLV